MAQPGSALRSQSLIQRKEQASKKGWDREAGSDSVWGRKEMGTLKTEPKQTIPNKQTHRMTLSQCACSGK